MDTTEAALIQHYLEPNPQKPGIDEVRLKEYGVPVWALIGHLPAVGGDHVLLARDYDVPVEAVEAAYRYYLRYRSIIDARIAANNGELADVFQPA